MGGVMWSGVLEDDHKGDRPNTGPNNKGFYVEKAGTSAVNGYYARREFKDGPPASMKKGYRETKKELYWKSSKKHWYEHKAGSFIWWQPSYGWCLTSSNGIKLLYMEKSHDRKHPKPA